MSMVSKLSGLGAGAVHRLEAVTDCDFFEVSTPQLEDVVRLDDRYGRTDAAPQS